MSVEIVHTLILGAGPSGLAAGYTLAKAGARPVIVDRETAHGGLMRSIRHEDFTVDVGRKELYNRLSRVDEFWTGLLGRDYRPYPHRGGLLYDGRIIELSRNHRGFLRGMSVPTFAACAAGLFTGRMAALFGPPRNVEQFFYRTRGKLMTRIAAQGFQEKLTGQKWAELGLPDNFSDPNSTLFSTLRAAAARARTRGDVNTYGNVWRHPAKGTGQICDAMAKGIMENGGSFHLGAKLLSAKASSNSIVSVTVEMPSEVIEFRPENVISTIPVDALLKLLGQELPAHYTATLGKPSQRRTVVLVYLFLTKPPRFPHAWLQVTAADTRIGRITNYSGFDSDMVPAGKGCLCCEYYCFGADPLLDLDPTALAKETFEYCQRTGLADPGSLQDTRVLKLPGADASQNRHNWMTSLRSGLLDAIKPYTNLYFAGRTDLDIATLAGLEAAEAILSRNRATFDSHFDPTQIGIRSERKAFEFKLPSAVRP